MNAPWWTGPDDRPGLDPDPEPTERCAGCNIALERVAIIVTEPQYPHYVHKCCGDNCAADVRARLEE